MNNEIKISIGILFVGLLALMAYWFQGEESVPKLTSNKMIEERVILPQYSVETYRNIPEVQSYLKDLRAVIQSGHAVLPLQSNELDSAGASAQAILLKNADFLKDTVENGKLLHNDMMRIKPAIVSVLNDVSKRVCATHRCYQAEKYNFVTNATTRAIVDVDDKRVLEVKNYANMQPDISLRLKHIAQAIALNAPEVAKELKHKARREDMSMANVRGALQESPCQNSEHLCVAPTFSDHKKEQALWAIVDLTELTLAAAKWAGLGKTTTPACISERSLQNRYIMKNFCEKDSYHEQNGWELTYRMTGSDGLEIIDVSFKGKAVLKSAKIVDWHVAYEGKGEVDDSGDIQMAGRRVEFVKAEEGKFFFGYNDAMGCPMFSTSVVLPFNGPLMRPLYDENRKKVGFYLTQDYRNPKWPMACNYRYENRFEFFDDGSFRVVGVNKGRGCGEEAIYRPVMRVDMALGEKEEFYKYDGSWNKWFTEQSDFQKDAILYENDKYLYKITDENGIKGYYIEPNRGQFNDQSRGDNATVFVSKYKEDEGEQDLLTLGSCCNLAEDGAERYISTNESIDGENLVIWYVPRIRNDAREGHEYCWADTVIGEDGNIEVRTFPCVVGPKFVPIK
ncbi:hypothetical protein KKC13_11630 [bacterium]|nr:hypothetical protein [bacterium]MBU1957547.1 hypothetical protein [bacterium]